MKQDLDIQTIIPQAKQSLTHAKRYYAFIFFLVLAGIYGFLLFQINIHINAQPDESAIKAETAKKLSVDENVAQQLQELEDNSVNVQALFDEARANPFQE